jgi:hypothetical protein
MQLQDGQLATASSGIRELAQSRIKMHFEVKIFLVFVLSVFAPTSWYRALAVC